MNNDRSKNIYIETYGCQMNLSDSELMAGVLTANGHRIVDELEQADVILVNTCAVREHAEQRVIGRLGDLKRYKYRNPNLILGVCGCMAQHLGEYIIEEVPYVDVVMGPDSYRNLPQAIDKRDSDKRDACATKYLCLNLDKTENYLDVEPMREDGVRAWLTVMRGCDKICTFCIVPFVRGRERSVPFDRVLDDARRIVDEGFKEVVLLGQTVNSYNDGEHDFADLLYAISKIEGIERIRFTSPHPVDVTSKMIDAIADIDKVCKQIHLPMQSDSTRILKLMRRGYTAEEYLELVFRMRDRIPDLAISTDVIVGFCGETEEDFKATYNMMSKIRFDSAFMFKYSSREGTIAHKILPDDVPPEVKSQRLTEIIELQEQISLEINQSLLGERFDVLIEGTSKRDPEQFCGKTDGFKTAVFPRDRMAEPGKIVKVKVNNATAHTLFGKRVKG